MAIPGRAGDLWPVKAPEWEVSGSPRLNLARGTVQAEETAWKGIGGQLLAGPGKACILYLSVCIQVVVTGKRTDGERGQLPPKERLTLSGLWRGFFSFQPKTCFHKEEQGKDCPPPPPSSLQIN